MGVVFSQMIDDARNARMHIGTAEVFSGDHFTSRCLDQRRTAEKNSTLVLDDDRLVAHRWHVGAAGRARAEHSGDLRNASRRQVGLVEENAAEVFLIREDFILHRQKGTAGIDQIDAGQAIFQRDFLRPQVLFHRQRVVGAALYRGIVGNNHAFDAFDAADADDHRRRRHIPTIHIVGGELGDFEKGRAGVEQGADPFARQQLAARQVLLACRLGAAEGDLVDLFMQIGNHRLHRCRVGQKVRAARVELGFKDGHVSSLFVSELEVAYGEDGFYQLYRLT